MAMQSRAAQNDRSASQLSSLSWEKKKVVKLPVYLTGKARRINHKPARRLKACYFPFFTQTTSQSTADRAACKFLSQAQDRVQLMQTMNFNS